VVDEAIDRLSGLDIVVNNAGICFHRPALEVPDEEWDAVFNINVRALWQVSKAAGAYQKEHGGGAIVNIGSISAMIVNRPSGSRPTTPRRPPTPADQVTRRRVGAIQHPGQRAGAGLYQN
jgi:NAD(P)-dependent dehydrogenase (short-subunit alcohol dehydrogenase family)